MATGLLLELSHTLRRPRTSSAADFVEIEEIGGANFGGGNCQICLDTMTLDWACG
ncbi:MAG: hypothetical protein AAFP04_16475 [Myxococcota bacterium]